MRIKAYAKINLSLDAIGKRADGYHLLKMIMQNIDLYDVLDIEKSDNPGIFITCNKNYVPTDERNLVYRAAKLFMENYDIKQGIKIHISKNIPVAAGLAGGSTDAAATLKAMNILYGINVSNGQLMELALKIGADVPYCITGGTALCEGIGEVITDLPAFKNHILVLVKPPFGVSTKEVYEGLEIHKIYKHPDTEAIVQGIRNNDLEVVCSNMKNVLENVTLQKHGLLRAIKKEMMNMGAMGALMSGSGPTVFGIFEDMLQAQRCYERLQKKYNETFITRTI